MSDDWKGEHLVRIPRNPHAGSGLNMKTKTIHTKKANTIARREKVAKLVGTGLTETDMAAKLGCSHTCIRNDLRALGLVR